MNIIILGWKLNKIKLNKRGLSRNLILNYVILQNLISHIVFELLMYNSCLKIIFYAGKCTLEMWFYYY